MKIHRLAIVGSGISGLACAHYLTKNGRFEIVVFESSLKPGGQAAPIVVDDVPLDMTVIGFHLDA